MVKSKVKLRDVIFLYSSAAKQNEAAFLRLWHLAFTGFINMQLGFFDDTKTVNLPINANGTVTIPPDCLNIIAVGPLGESGIISQLRRNTNLTRYRATASTRRGDVGWGGSDLDSFDIDTVNNSILLNPNYTGSRVGVRYKYIPQQNDDYEIPVQFQQAMIDFLAWMDIKYLPVQSHFGRGNVQDRAMAFDASLKVAKMLYKPFTLQDADSIHRDITDYQISNTI